MNGAILTAAIFPQSLFLIFVFVVGRLVFAFIGTIKFTKCLGELVFDIFPLSNSQIGNIVRSAKLAKLTL